MDLTPRIVGQFSASGGLQAKKYSVEKASGFDANLDPTKDSVTANPSVGTMADYYRYGKYNDKGEKELSSKSLTPFDTGPASIRVYGKEAKSDVSKDFIPPYTKFILESTQEGHTERSQIIETFGDFYVFFFGERPPIYTYSGTLINTQNVNWVSDFYMYYNGFLRGTKCVEKNARIILTYGGAQVEGYILSFNTQKNAANELAVPIAMQVVITKRNTINLSDDFGIVVTDKQVQTIVDALKRIAGKEGKGMSAANISEAFGKTSTVMGGGMASQVSSLIA